MVLAVTRVYPDRQDWLSTAQRAVGDIDISNLVIVGHSLGVTVVLDFVESASTPTKMLVSARCFMEIMIHM
jgi:predicted alpha/beta hydrolase family esterase